MTRTADPVVTAKRIAIAEAAIERYGAPASELRISAVTGTNGRTALIARSSESGVCE